MRSSADQEAQPALKDLYLGSGNTEENFGFFDTASRPDLDATENRLTFAIIFPLFPISSSGAYLTKHRISNYLWPLAIAPSSPTMTSLPSTSTSTKPFTQQEMKELETSAKEVQLAERFYVQAKLKFQQVLDRASGAGESSDFPSQEFHEFLTSSPVLTDDLVFEQSIATRQMGNSTPFASGASDGGCCSSNHSPFLDAGAGGFENVGSSLWDFDNPVGATSLPASNSSGSLTDLFSSTSPSMYPRSSSAWSSSPSSISPDSVSPHSLFLSPFDGANSDFGSATTTDLSWLNPAAFGLSGTDCCDDIAEERDETDWYAHPDGVRRSYYGALSTSAPPLIPTPFSSSTTVTEQQRSQFGRERSSSSLEVVRFSPMSRPTLSPSVSPTIFATTSTQPDLEISDLSLSSPLVRAASTGSGRGSSATTSRRNSVKKSQLSMTLSSSVDDNKLMIAQTRRAARGIPQFNYDPDVLYLKNDKHVFVVFTQMKKEHTHTTDASERWITELFLTDPPVNSPLDLVTRTGEQYSPELFAKDRNTYTFGDASGATWNVTYTGYSAGITPCAPISSSSSRSPSPVYTFVHFPPGSFTTSSLFPIGSIAWWRLQACEARVRHNDFPGEGWWTARYDADPSKRRPARIIEHFATCKHRRVEGDHFALGKLARAIHIEGNTKSPVGA